MPTQRFHEFGAYRLDAGRRRLLRGGQVVSLTPKVMDVLLALAERDGQAQLIKVADGYHLWSETYERDAKGGFAFQEEICRDIVAVLGTSASAQAIP